MNCRRWIRALALIAVLGLAPAAQAGPTLWISDSNGRLGQVDVATGAVSGLVNMGITMTDIAYSPTGVLYGTSFSSLYTINPLTGATTLVGTHNANLNALVFRTDGTLFAAGGSTLYTLNQGTGATTSVGAMGFGSSGDLAFNGGDLFLAASTGSNDTLVKIGLPNAAGTAVGAMGFPSVFGLATAGNGILYGVSNFNIFSINTTTGAGSLVSSYAGGLGIAFGTTFYEEAIAVPEPMTAIGFAGAMLGLAAVRRLRKPKG
jgi:hypothetical protein